jgi:hypothetical protein
MNPIKPFIAYMKRIRTEYATADSLEIPAYPKRRMNVASRVPIPDIERGSNVIKAEIETHPTR